MSEEFIDAGLVIRQELRAIKHAEDMIELRDRFACAALTGLLAGCAVVPTAAVEISYAISDLMLAQREKKG